MVNPAFIVDGFTEKLILQKLCPGSPINRTDLNGKSVSIDAMAKKISSMIRLLGNRYYPIIIIIDKEQRRQPTIEIEKELKQKISGEGIKDNFIVGVADRMLENWIIADWGCLNVEESKPRSTEGGNGASHIKKVKGNYNKTTDGVELFLQTNPKIIYENSESFRSLVDKLQNIHCDFLGKIK